MPEYAYTTIIKAWSVSQSVVPHSIPDTNRTPINIVGKGTAVTGKAAYMWQYRQCTQSTYSSATHTRLCRRTEGQKKAYNGGTVGKYTESANDSLGV
ncbi:hypothetical protein CHS0354_027562 [Potamilus streckersoni]|uniref:Uncharacterized protein n=1 Tax=Potamilus streckersoni TaxID=2493646 RepID=A0AAE0S0Q7_9BIVA|nr:hypothetical protein CHS0354_027562 [Potamilus streckersoni]